MIFVHTPDNVNPPLPCDDDVLRGRFKQVPHPCNDPTCQGDINRRKLEAWDLLMEKWPVSETCSECRGTKDVLTGAGFCSDCFEKALHRVWNERQAARDAAQAAQHAACLELVAILDEGDARSRSAECSEIIARIGHATRKVTEVQT